MKKKSNEPVSVRVGHFEFLKLNAGKQEWRDVYHWILSLSWPRFAALMAGLYLAINALFAIFYSPRAMGSKARRLLLRVILFQRANARNRRLRTHVSGHTLRAHCDDDRNPGGRFLVAVFTGVIFVRFSRPTARIEFSNSIVISPFNGKPTLMLRVANLRHHSMVEAEFKIMLTRDEPIENDEEFRHFYLLKLHFDHLISFPTALTLRHTIDETSPLYGQTMESLQANDTHFVASIVCIETVIPAAVQTQRSYSWREVRFGERFVDIYTDRAEGQITVDYGRLHETEPVAESSSVSIQPRAAQVR